MRTCGTKDWGEVRSLHCRQPRCRTRACPLFSRCLGHFSWPGISYTTGFTNFLWAQETGSFLYLIDRFGTTGDRGRDDQTVIRAMKATFDDFNLNNPDTTLARARRAGYCGHESRHKLKRQNEARAKGACMWRMRKMVYGEPVASVGGRIDRAEVVSDVAPQRPAGPPTF